MRRDPEAEARRRRRWYLGPTLALTATLALVAGCGGRDDAGTTSAASSETDQAAKFAQCMRENGVPDFPDPTGGGIQLNAQPGSGLDPNSPQFKQAQQACQDQAPAGLQSGSGSSSDTQAQLLKFAKCMRENGVPDFPDPTVQAGGIVVGQAGEVDTNSPEFKRAQQACNQLLSGLGGAQ
jgi:hypothetical protein